MQVIPVQRIRSLDSLRGLAAITVVFHHILRLPPDMVHDHLSYVHAAFAMGARLAVILFFVLSGFVLGLPYFKGTNDAYVPFVVRRFIRLYLPYAFAILVAALLCNSLGGRSIPTMSEWMNSLWSSPVTPDVLAAHLLITGIHFNSFRLDVTIWSLIIEMRIAPIFPFMVRYVRWSGVEGVFLALLAAFMSAKTGAYIGETLSTSPVVSESPVGALLLTISYLFFFMLGIIAAARLEKIKEILARVAPKFHAAIVAGIFLAWIALLYFGFAGRGYIDVLYGLMSAYLITACIAFPRLAAKLSGRVCLWLGDISYSLYLIHVPVLIAVFYLAYGRLSSGTTIIMALPMVLIAAHLMHRFVERPSIILSRNMARRLADKGA